MATKPSVVPTWADDGAALVTVPLVAKRAIGWDEGEQPPADYLNWWQELVGEWMQYLSDGAFSGNVLFSGSLFDVNGTATFNGLVDIQNEIEVDTGAHIDLRGAAHVKHPERTLGIPWSKGDSFIWPLQLSPPSTMSTPSFWANPAAVGAVSFPIELQEDERIKSVSARVRATAGGGNTISVYLVKTDPTTGVRSQIGSTATSTAAATDQLVTVSGLTEVVDPTKVYEILVGSDSTTTTTHRIYGCEVTYDRV